MSVTEPPLPGEEFELVKQPAKLSAVCLNDIFKGSLKKARISYPADIVVRCESFPSIPGSGDHFSELFDHLLCLVFEMPGAAGKLLHVNCDEETVTSGPDNRKYKNYIIRFQTNSSITDEWKIKQASRFSRCTEIVSKYEGSFMANTISNTGCVFFITLPANHV